jgi:undecaprenyl-diphosphatase
MSLLNQIQSWDLALQKLINQQWTAPWLDTLMAAISSPALFLPFLIIGFVAALLLGSFRLRIFVLLALLNLGIGDGIINQELRSLIQRNRPHERVIGTRRVEWRQDDDVRVRITEKKKKDASGNSMPSGHVLNNTSVAYTAAVLFPALRWPLALWVVLMGYARVYTGAHYPSDVLVSILLALGYAFLFLRGANALWVWRKGHWPRLARLHPTLFPQDDQPESHSDKSAS